MKLNQTVLLTVVSVMLIPQIGFCWGDEGHSITALVAQQALLDQSKTDPRAAMALATVKSILGDTTFDQAAVWPDKMKSEARACVNPPYVKDPNYGRGDKKGQSSAICEAYKYTSNWHFINMDGTDYTLDPSSKDYYKGDLVVLIKGLVHSLKGESADILNGVSSYTKWKQSCLKKPDHTAQSCKKEALEFLIHFSGDIHQPLHAGAECDIGGNNQYVTFFGEVKDPAAYWCKPTDPANCSNHELHQLWDATLLLHGAKTSGLAFENEYTSSLVKNFNGRTESSDPKKCMMVSPTTPINVDEPNGPLAWVHESACLIPQVYTFPDESSAAAAKAKSKTGVKASRATASASEVTNRCRTDKQIDVAHGHAFSAFAIGQKYADLNLATINERLYWGGQRLASILKDIYGQGDKAPDFDR